MNKIIVTFWFALIMLCNSKSLFAVDLRPGDILVVDHNYDRITRVNPVTGDQSRSTIGFSHPVSLAIKDSSYILFTDDIDQALYKYDLNAKILSIISSGGEFESPSSIVIEESDQLLVGDSGKILHIDPTTGTQTVLSSGPDLGFVTDIILDGNGNIFASDSSNGKIIKVDPVSGARTPILPSGTLEAPKAIALDSNGNIIAVDATSGLVIRVNPVSGAHTEITKLSTSYPGGPLERPQDMVIDADDRIFIITTNLIYEINPTTGNQIRIRDVSNEHDYTAIALDEIGHLVYVTASSFVISSTPRIERIDPNKSLALPELITASGGMGEPQAVLVDPDGKLISAGWGLIDDSRKQVYRIDPVTAIRKAICCLPHNGEDVTPSAITLDQNNDLLVAGAYFSQRSWYWKLVRYNITTDQETTITSGNYIPYLNWGVKGLVADNNGRVFVLLNNTTVVIEVDPITGFLTTLIDHDAIGGVLDYSGMAIDKSGDLLVINAGSGIHRISTATGELLETISVYNRRGITVDQQGRYISTGVSGSYPNQRGFVSRYDPMSKRATTVSSGDRLSPRGLANVAVVPCLVSLIDVHGVCAEIVDSDGDGLNDNIEALLGTNPNLPDTDNDGLLDGEEDKNKNGVIDFGETNPTIRDTDYDGFSDGYEVKRGSDPLNPHSVPKDSAMPWLLLLLE